MSDAAPPPPAGAASPAASVPATARGGPIGEARSALVVLLLSIVTFGIYALWWDYRQYEDLKAYRGQGVGGVVGLIIVLFVGIVTPFLMASEVEKMYAEAGEKPPVSAMTGFWVFLPLIGYIIWLFKVQGAISDFWVARGATAK